MLNKVTALLAALLLSGAVLPAQTRNGSFNLAAPATTSAGVYDASGNLVRTLWSGVRYNAGTQSFTWDGKDQFGSTLNGTYTAKVIAHNVQHVWEGVVGNTSKNLTGPDKHRSFESIWGLAFAPNGEGYIAVGYNEQQYPVYRFHMTNYQGRVAMGHDDYQRAFKFVVTDGTRTYFANTGSGFNNLNFVIAFDITKANYPQFIFSSGSVESPSQPGQRWESVIDRGSSVISGMAVQSTGNLLLVAHQADNVVKVFDKVSGAFLRQFTVSAPENLAITPSGDVWVLSSAASNPKLIRFTNLGGTPTAATTVGGFSYPLALAVTPDGATVVVADGGTSQQLKAYNTSGANVWTFGQAGGYSSSPDVTTDKFMFRDRTYWADRAYVAFSPDGRMWVGDAGNERTLIYDANRNYLDQIMYLPHSYTSAADLNDPSRVFNYWQEFRVDYTKPIQQSWTLVKNWSAGQAKNRFSGFGEGIQHVITLTAGAVRRTFTVVPDFSIVGPDKYVCFELSASGLMRDTGLRFPEAKSIYSDGTIRYREDTGGVQKIWSQPFTGFDGNGNPTWGGATLLATAPAGGTDPIYRGAFSSMSGPRFPTTQSGTVIFFDQQKKDPNYKGWHLGGVQTGATSWKWRSSPSGSFKKDCDAGMDPVLFPVAHRPCWYQEGEIVLGDGTYDVTDPYTQYGGNRVMTVGKSVVYGYHGEFWNNGQANQWMHFHENGLFVGQFGKVNAVGPNKEAALPGAAGNSFAPALVSANGKTYLWHNDESVHAGVHRWLIDGMDQLQEINVAFGGAANQSPSTSLTAPANNASFTAPASITLTANASDADGSVSKVEFFNGTTLLGTDTSAPYSFTWSGVTAGSYSLTSRATDNSGAAADSSVVTVIVSNPGGANAAPTASLTSPANGANLGTAPASLSLAATAADSDGSVSLVEFFQNGVKIGQDSTSPYTFSVSGLAAGSYTFTVKATDNLGSATTSAGATVTVNAAAATNTPPTVSLTGPANGANLGTAPVSATLNATASDTGGSVTVVEFFQNGVKVGEDFTSPYSFTVSGLTAGSYSFTAKATDNLGATTTSAAATITVSAPPVAAGSATVNWNDVKQEIDGFGAATPGSAMWIKNFNEPARSQIMNLLFSVTNGVGFSMVRAEITADNHDAFATGDTEASVLQPKINNHQPTEGNWYWEGDESQVWFMQESKKLGASRFLSSVWSPPPWMKFNNDYRGNTGTNATVRPDKYQAYADYLSRYVREYKTRFGIDITAIAPAAEPDFPAWYQACLWTPGQMVDFLKNYLGPTFQRDGVTAWVTAPENAHWGSMERANEILADPGARAAVQIIANHGYDMSYDPRPSVKAAGKRLWQTEVCELNVANNSTMANALMWAKNIHNHLTVAESSAWLFWYMSTPDIDGTSGSLIYQTYNAPWYTANRRTFRYGKRLHAIGNYSRFVRPGYVRLGVSANLPSGVYLSAYKDPVGGQLSIVAINDTDSTQNISLSLSGTSGITGFTPYVTTATQDLEPQAPLTVSSGNFNAGLAPRSVITFVRNASPLPAAPIADSFLSDLQFAAQSKGDIDPVQTDLSAAGTYLQGYGINLKGTNHAKGLGFTAPSTLIYHLDGKCSTFTSVAGATQGGVRFQVYADDQLVFDTGSTVSANDNPRNVNVSVAGKKMLKLVATGSGSQGVWASAKVAYVGGPSVVVTAPANNAYYPAAASVTLSATASTSATSSVARVEFYNGTTLLGQDTSSPFSFTWNSAANGTNLITARAVDASGLVATSAPVTVFVGVNQLPSVTLANPANGSSFNTPASLTLTANASDSDGTIARVEFYNGTTLLGQATAAPYSFTWSNVLPGVYNLTAKAVDNTGGTSTSAPSSVTITPPVNQLPTVSLTAPANNTTYTNIPATISISASAFDSDGAVAKVEFFNGATKLGETTSSPYTFTWNSVPAGAYSLTARATDNLGAVAASGSVSVRVGAAGTPVFWRGINFGGNAVTVNGNNWIGQSTAQSSGLTLSPTPFSSTTSVTPVPGTDAATSSMLNSCVWSQNDFTVSQTASNGTYQIYFYAMENYLANFRSLNVQIEGNTVATDIGNQWAVGQWVKYGPFEVTITDGAITLDLVKVSWDPCLMGLEIFSLQSGGGGGTPANIAPTVALTSPASGGSFTAPANLSLAATASDSDGSISRVEFYNGATLIGTATSSPYTFLYNNAAPGSYALKAVAFDNSGASTASAVANVTVTSPGSPTLSVALTSPTPGANFKSGDPITVTAGVTDSTAPGAAASKAATAARVATGGLDLDVADVLQEIDGFGTAFIAMAGILQQYPEPLRTRIVDMLFNTNNGAGFSMVRSEMISDDHDKNDALWSWAVPGINSVQPTKGTWNWTGDDAQIWMMKQAQARGVKTFLSTVWSPVPWLKDNNSYIRGYVKPGSYQDYADYLSRYIREYQTRFGIPITHISPIHEPGYPANYQSCDWTPEQARNLLRDYLAPTFARDAVPAKVVLAEVNNWSGTMGHINPTLDDPAAAARLDIVAGHGYEATPLYDYHARAFQAGKKVWISEDCDLYSPRAVLDSDWVARNWVKMMHGYLTKARVSLWAHWYGFNGAWDGAGLTYSSAALSGSGASDYPAGRRMDFKAVKALHTMTHTTRFVRPGYRLLNTTFSPATDIYTMAFANPANGQVVIVAMNDTDADYNLTGAINGSTVASLKPYVTDTKGVRNVAPQPRITVNGSVFNYTIPARGVITLVRDEAQPAPPAAGAKTYVSDLKWSSSGAGYIGSIPVEIDKSLGGEFGGDGGTLRIRGTNYAKGLGLQGSAHITYHLAGRATNFSAIIGVDDAATSGNSVTFQVWGDGVKLYESPAINKSSGANGQRINVNVAGRQEIALVVNGDNQANWADASVDTGAVSGAPVVNITSPAGGATFTAPASFAINASATDSDGTVSRVDFLNGTTLISSDTSSPFSASLSGLAAGTYNLQAVAYDNSGIPSAPAYVSVTVNASNPPPAAATVLVEFYADGLKIGQASNAPYTMTWNGAAGGSRVLSAKATRLSNNEIANSLPVNITVGAPANGLPTASVTSPFSGATYTSPANITLTATAGDSDGTVSKVEFYNGVNLIGTATSAPYTFVWNNVSPGAYSINARATDNQGGIGNSPVVNFSVTPPANQPPTVAVTLPTNNAIFPTAPANIALSAVAADADGTVVKVEFFDGANKLGEVLSSPFSFNWLNVSAGNHSLTARATDNQGAVTTSAALSILVGAPGTPIFWRGINFGGGSVVIDGNAWVSHTVAETVGLSFSPRPNFSTTAFTPTPAVTGDVGPMLNSCAWAQNGFSINQTASNGTYQIYFWVMENYLANFRDINFKLEGNTVATQVGKGWSVGQWSKYGPYEVTVTDGVINLELEKVAWDPTIMGLAIYRVIPQNTQLPALTLTAPANGTVVTGPANLTLTASANDTNNAITRVEFYSSDTKLGEKSSPPYTLALNNVAPGSYNFFAVAYNAVGANTIATPALVNVVRPGLADYALLSNGTFQLALPGQAGMTNTVEVSTNLTQWTVLTNLLGGAGNQLFTDAQAGVLSRRYYRVRVNGVATSNAVGFARIASPAGYSIIANPFIPATNTVAAIFRNVPNGTTVAKFRNETSDYAVNSYDASYNIWDEPDQSFGNGEAAFLFNPLTNGITITFVGALSSGTVSRQLPQGYSMLGATWPQDGPLVGTHGYSAGDGDIVYRFRDGRYVNSQYFGAFGAWDSEPDLKVGEGFFLFRPAPGTWTRSFSVSQ